ncbi:MAG: hypothetical protein EA383_02615 [Spirochaetaceae bacterium]|nr:MAG: hypothetical protein EA383_02615 [Spirochaetaceae bacterium]
MAQKRAVTSEVALVPESGQAGEEADRGASQLFLALPLLASMGRRFFLGEGGKLPGQPTVFSIGKFALSPEAKAGGEQ